MWIMWIRPVVKNCFLEKVDQSGGRIDMTDFERNRLNRYIGDAEQWLVNIQKILFQAETPAQGAAATLTRAALELVAGIRQQMMIDGN